MLDRRSTGKYKIFAGVGYLYLYSILEEKARRNFKKASFFAGLLEYYLDI
jgi:hypothetical protein